MRITPNSQTTNIVCRLFFRRGFFYAVSTLWMIALGNFYSMLWRLKAMVDASVNIYQKSTPVAAAFAAEQSSSFIFNWKIDSSSCWLLLNWIEEPHCRESAIAIMQRHIANETTDWDIWASMIMHGFHRQLQFNNLFNNSHQFWRRHSFISRSTQRTKAKKQSFYEQFSCCTHSRFHVLLAYIIRKIINIYCCSSRSRSQFVVMRTKNRHFFFRCALALLRSFRTEISIKIIITNWHYHHDDHHLAATATHLLDASVWCDFDSISRESLCDHPNCIASICHHQCSDVTSDFTRTYALRDLASVPFALCRLSRTKELDQQ